MREGRKAGPWAEGEASGNGGRREGDERTEGGGGRRVEGAASSGSGEIPSAPHLFPGVAPSPPFPVPTPPPPGVAPHATPSPAPPRAVQIRPKSHSKSTTGPPPLSRRTSGPAVVANSDATSSKNAAMAELKSRVLTALANLSDGDTHHIAVKDLGHIIRSLPSADVVPMVLYVLASDSLGLASPPRGKSPRHLTTLCAAAPARVVL